MKIIRIQEIDELPNAYEAAEAITKILQKWPSEFDQDLRHHYERFALLSEKEFRAHRSVKQQVRIVCFHYLMLKKLLRRKWLEPKLDVEMRLLPTQLQFVFGQKPVLGIAIAIHLSSHYERFEDQHILLATQKLLPSVQAVHESFWTFHKPRDRFRLLYLEVEKNQNAHFSLSEIKLLKSNLQEELKKHVETLSPSTFGNYDVEETMRNIFSLSQELTHASDVPQVMISFERASSSTLVFKIVMVRALTEQASPISESLFRKEDSCEYVHERSSIIGHLSHHKIQKEASVFRLHIQKKPSLIRSDFSFNLYRARQYVNSLLVKAFGEVRDYNGGIFSKQLELFAEFKHHFKHIADQNPELLEDFFYAISPPEMQATISFSLLNQLFTLFLQVRKSSFPKGENVVIQTKREGEVVFAIVLLKKSVFGEQMTSLFDEQQFSLELITWLHLKDHETIVLGYIYQHNSLVKRDLFCEALQGHLERHIAKIRNVQSLHFSQPELPVSLDPRLGGDVISGTIIKMLFEGLFRIGKNGKPQLAVAKDVSISEGETRYLFKLRECYWNNGDRVTATDFSLSWKRILTPNFHSSFSHLLYSIRNAKRAKAGIVSLDQIGVSVLDDETLMIELEHPCSYFLELLAHPLYSPVNHRIDLIYHNWHLQTGAAYVCNGPFQLEDFDRQESYQFKKNPLYWDRDAVRIDHIRISKANDRIALDMYQKGETDWLGRPFQPWGSFFPQNEKLGEKNMPISTYWYVFNVKQFPFHSLKLRQAFAHAIDRKALVGLLSHYAIPAFSPLPLIHSQFPNIRFKPDVTYSPDYARNLLETALQEMNTTHAALREIILLCPNYELRKKIALTIIQNWQEVLGIVVKIECCSFKDLFLRMAIGEHQMGLIGWGAEVDDPLYTLEVFKNSTDGINFSKWENIQYQSLLQKAAMEVDLKKRQALYAKAEEILIEEVPVIPIIHEVETFVKKNYIEGVVFPSNVGAIDFKYAYIKR